MANAMKGESDITISGKRYTLVVSMYAYAMAQDALTKGDKVPSIDLIGERLDAGHALTVIALFWGSLQKYHPHIQTLEQATDLMEQSNGEAAKTLINAVRRATPEAADLRELDTANPPQAQGETSENRGTGDRPTSALAKSA